MIMLSDRMLRAFRITVAMIVLRDQITRAFRNSVAIPMISDQIPHAPPSSVPSKFNRMITYLYPKIAIANIYVSYGYSWKSFYNFFANSTKNGIDSGFAKESLFTTSSGCSPIRIFFTGISSFLPFNVCGSMETA